MQVQQLLRIWSRLNNIKIKEPYSMRKHVLVFITGMNKIYIACLRNFITIVVKKIYIYTRYFILNAPGKYLEN